MNFAVETKVENEQLLAYQKIGSRTIRRKKMTILKAAMLITGVMGIAGGFVSIRAMGKVEPLAVVAMTMGVVLLVQGFNYDRYLAWKNRLRIGTGMTQQFFFEDTRLIAQSGKERITHNYGAFKVVAESQDYYVLFLNKIVGYILPKKGFFQGDPAEFTAFLEEKTGKKVQFVKI